MPTVEAVSLSVRAGFAECPTWDAATATLLWVDLNAGTVHRYDPADGTDSTVATMDQPVAAAKPRATGGLALSLRDGVAVTTSESDGPTRWLTRWADEGVRGNDAGVDGAGCLFVVPDAGRGIAGAPFDG
ncbi:SMP-30/gluconolactonase/LRE family protein [Streptomyces sp. NPDC054796]